MTRSIQLMMLLALAAVIGCARSSAQQPVSAGNNGYLLPTEPAGAIDVIGIREEGQDQQPVVVVGRVGAGAKPWIDGRAAFTLVDQRVLPSCDEEQCDENCAKCAEELADATILIKFVDLKGKVLNVDARKLLGLKDQQTIVVTGVANRDESGSISIVGHGVFARE